MATEATQTDDAPRQEVDLYGEPVLERQINDEYWEAYVWEESTKLFIAKYVRCDGGWVKTGVECMDITDIHLEAFSRRKNGGL